MHVRLLIEKLKMLFLLTRKIEHAHTNTLICEKEGKVTNYITNSSSIGVAASGVTPRGLEINSIGRDICLGKS